MQVLFVCTGNICRSPMAEVLLAARLAERGVAADVSSAGLLDDGRRAADHGIAVMAARGLDTRPHRSRSLRPALLVDADLVLGLAREHVREVVAAWPAGWPRSFTLKEIVRRGEEVGPRPDGTPLADWLAVVGNGRRPDDLVGHSPDDDVADPIGQPLATYERTAAEIDDLTLRLARLLAGGH